MIILRYILFGIIAIIYSLFCVLLLSGLTDKKNKKKETENHKSRENKHFAKY